MPVVKIGHDHGCRRRCQNAVMKIGAIVPQGWTGEYDGWDTRDAWRRTVDGFILNKLSQMVEHRALAWRPPADLNE